MNLKAKPRLTLAGFLFGTFVCLMTLGTAYISYGAVSWSEIGTIHPAYFIVAGIGFALAIVSIFLASYRSKGEKGG